MGWCGIQLWTHCTGVYIMELYVFVESGTLFSRPELLGAVPVKSVTLDFVQGGGAP